MSDVRHGAHALRQMQWDAFHRWESEHRARPILLEERVAWYNAAFDFADHILPRPGKNIESKVQYTRDVRARLSHLK